MRVAVTGATGVVGRCVVPTLLAAGHDVVGVARAPEKARLLRDLGAEVHATSLFDHTGLVALLEGADAVVNLASAVPVGRSAVRPHGWRVHDRLLTDGVAHVLAAAREARVRRVVQHSASHLYADQGDGWIAEDSPLAITRATEPASVAESQVQDFVCGSRAGVVLRFGTVVGDDPLTRSQLRAVRHGHAIGLGSPDGWAHLVHTDDLGPAVLAALHVASGVYNVGAAPVRRVQLVAGYSRAAGRDSIDFVGPLHRRMGGVRLEPLTRSLRVCSDRFTAASGWTPRRAAFDPSWFAPAQPHQALR